MYPAFSVIFFTTSSGAGYGLWLWIALLSLTGIPLPRMPALLALALGFVLVSAGLLSSLLHLGKPGRAWRSFSQWRSSWLSREGVAAVTCYLPAVALAWQTWRGGEVGPAALLLAIVSVATVVCTAMIYASLKPVPAWRHPLVMPTYLVFAVFTGWLGTLAILAGGGLRIPPLATLVAMLLAVLAWRMKAHSWGAIDRDALPVSRNAALGLPEGRGVAVFERPHTEANYLLTEMGFVLARKHAVRLRTIAPLLFAATPVALCLPLWFFPALGIGPWLLAAAALAAVAGTFVERWLFFAEARHLVTLYY